MTPEGPLCTFKGEFLHPRLKDGLSLVPQPTIFAPDVTRDFLKAVIKDRFRNPPNISEEFWIRSRNITGVYLLSGANQRDLEQIYGISHERIRQLINTTLIYLWQNSSDEIKTQFPLSELSVQKPNNQWARIHKLLIRRGTGNRLIEAIEQGERADVIKKSPRSIWRRLQLLEAIGIKIPRQRRTEKEIIELVQKLQDLSLSDKQVQQLLDLVNRAFLNRDTRSEHPVLTSVRNLAGETAFHFYFEQTREFYEALKNTGLPATEIKEEVKSGPQKGERHHFIIASIHKDRAKKAFMENPNLSRFLENPVKLV